jgi:membrane-bound ClpP family serine protease
LASPFVAPWLLFAAMFLLSTEFSTPGIGVPGFLGSICLVLFFWSQYLDGNADWLEILLFALGVVFVTLELFVVPGFGIFGVGGVIMILAAFLLASQSFVFPETAADYKRLPISFLIVAGGIMGTVAAMIVLRNVLPKAPYFKKIMLEPPTRDESLELGVDREAMIDLSYLAGKKGVAITNLIPAGKARIAGRMVDVITDGRPIEKGQKIEVVHAVGNRVVVQELEG